MKQLPVELLSRIFVLGSIPNKPSPFLLKSDESFHFPPSSDFQVTVSQVSRYWRYAACKTAVLWSFIAFFHPSHIDRAEQFLERLPASHPFDVFVNTVAFKDHIPGQTLCRDEFHPVFDVIVPHVSRWRSFSLSVRDNQCKAAARTRLSTCGPGPNLLTLQLYHFEDWGTAENLHLATVRPPVMVFDGVLPALRNVSMIGVNLPWEHSPFLKSLHALEFALHRESVRPTYTQWSTFLRASPDLRQLSLHYSGPQIPSDGWPPAKPISLLRLHDLSLTDIDPEYLCSIFAYLVLPAVRTLALDLPEQDYSLFVKRAASVPLFPHLVSLRVTVLECGPEAWRAFLGSVPALEDIDVDFGRLPGGFFDVLLGEEKEKGKTKAKGMSLLLPRLRTVRLGGLDGSSLRRWMTHRAVHGAPNANLLDRTVLDRLERYLAERELEASQDRDLFCRDEKGDRRKVDRDGEGCVWRVWGVIDPVLEGMAARGEIEWVIAEEEGEDSDSEEEEEEMADANDTHDEDAEDGEEEEEEL